MFLLIQSPPISKVRTPSSEETIMATASLTSFLAPSALSTFLYWFSLSVWNTLTGISRIPAFSHPSPFSSPPLDPQFFPKIALDSDVTSSLSVLQPPPQSTYSPPSDVHAKSLQGHPLAFRFFFFRKSRQAPSPRQCRFILTL